MAQITFCNTHFYNVPTFKYARPKVGHKYMFTGEVYVLDAPFTKRLIERPIFRDIDTGEEVAFSISELNHATGQIVSQRRNFDTFGKWFSHLLTAKVVFVVRNIEKVAIDTPIGKRNVNQYTIDCYN